MYRQHQQMGFFQSPDGMIVNPQAYIGVNHTQNLAPAHRSTFSEAVLRRDPTIGLKLYPLLESTRSGVTHSNSKIFTIKRNFHPTLRLAAKLPDAKAGQASTLKVETTNGIIPNMTFIVNPLGEHILITDVIGDSEIVVLRQLGSLNSSGAPAGTTLLYSGDAFEQGSLRPLMRNTGSSQMVLNTQIMRHSWGETGTLRETLKARDIVEGGISGVYDSKEEAMRNHALSLESWVLFGQRSFNNYNGMPMHTASGLLEFISASAPQNVVTVAGGTNVTDLGNIFESLGDVTINGSFNNRRTLYVNKAVPNTISAIAAQQGNPQYTVGQQTDIIGRRYTSFQTPRMSFDMEEHPLLNTDPSQAGMAIAVDPTTLRVEYLGSRKTQHQYYNADEKGNILPVANDNGIDQHGGTFTTEVMLVCENPAANGLFLNLLEARPSYDKCCK